MAEKKVREDVLRKIVDCARQVPRGSIFDSNSWNSFVCPLSIEEQDGSFCGEEKDFSVVLRRLNQFSESCGFSIIKAGSIENSSVRFTCECAGKHHAKADVSPKVVIHTKKRNCPWSIKVRRIEKAVLYEGVIIQPGMHVVKYPDFDHNHDLKVRLFLDGYSQADLNFSEHEEIEFWESARRYFDRRLTQSDAHSLLFQHSPAFRKIIEAKKITPESLYSKLRAEEGSPSPSSTACHEFIQFLLQQQRDKDSEFYVSFILDPITHALVGVIWASGEMRKWGKLFTELVIFDTTHGTNIFEFFLGVWAIEDSHGETLITAVCLLAHQDAKLFKWAFNQYEILIGAKPSAYMTDGDAAIAQALVQCEVHCHLLCIWHLLCRNGPTNLKDHLTQEAQVTVLHKLREFAYEDDDRFADDHQIQREWDELMKYVEEQQLTSRRDLQRSLRLLQGAPSSSAAEEEIAAFADENVACGGNEEVDGMFEGWLQEWVADGLGSQHIVAADGLHENAFGAAQEVVADETDSGSLKENVELEEYDENELVKKSGAKRWLNKLYRVRRKWVRRCMPRGIILKDVRASQRVESMNGLLASRLKKDSSLLHVYGAVKDITTIQSRKHRMHQNKTMLYNFNGRSNAFIKLDGRLTDFAMQKAAREDERMLHYFPKVIEDSHYDIFQEARASDGPQLVRKIVFLTTFNQERPWTSGSSNKERLGELKDEVVPVEKEKDPDPTLNDPSPFGTIRVNDRRIEIQFFEDGSVKSHCSCGYILSMGMPCRHWYCVAQICPEVGSTVSGLVHASWIKTYITRGLDSLADKLTTSSSQEVISISSRVLAEGRSEFSEEDRLDLVHARMRDIRLHAQAVGEILTDLPDGELYSQFIQLLRIIRRDRGTSVPMIVNYLNSSSLAVHAPVSTEVMRSDGAASAEADATGILQGLCQIRNHTSLHRGRGRGGGRKRKQPP